MLESISAGFIYKEEDALGVSKDWYSWSKRVRSSISRCELKSLVVYHLHMGKPVGPRSGQNVTQNSGKFRPGIAFTVCTNQFYLPKNDHESLKLVSKMALRKWNTRNIPSGKKGLVTNTFSDVLLLPEIFRWSDPNRRAPFRISRKLSVNGQQPLFQILFPSV